MKIVKNGDTITLYPTLPADFPKEEPITISLDEAAWVGEVLCLMCDGVLGEAERKEHHDRRS